MKPETLFLKVVVLLMGIPILALCVLGVPTIVGDAAEYFSGKLVYPVVTIIYVTAIVYFAALYQAFRLLSYIDKNEAFSELSVEALKKIKYCAITIGSLYVVALPFLFLMADMDDAPGLILFGMVPVFASTAVGVFAAVLQKLLKHAIDIKSENDLTV